MNTSSLLKPPGRRSRRRHSDDFKASVVAACNEPGVSIAAVALANGLNANLLRRWVIDADSSQPDRLRASPAASRKPAPPTTLPPIPPSFVPLHLPAPISTPTPAAIRIDLQRNGTAISISWPVSAAADCAAWLREWLR